MKTRHDFLEVAETIRHLKGAVKESYMQTWILRFESNPLFNVELFRQACGAAPQPKTFNLKDEWDKVDKTLAEIGERMSAPFHARARELIIQLSKFKGVKLNHLIMGMGGWVLNGTLPFKEYWGPNLSKVEEGTNDFEFGNFEKRSCWPEFYENVNPGICAVACELNSILETLTNEHYLQIFDIDDKEMKKMLTKASRKVK